MGSQSDGKHSGVTPPWIRRQNDGLTAYYQQIVNAKLKPTVRQLAEIQLKVTQQFLQEKNVTSVDQLNERDRQRLQEAVARAHEYINNVTHHFTSAPPESTGK